ncbi:MAG: DUF4331 family protein [Chthoniobacterales bacterium]|nr:DUF4331 family protein [Chthoniobacterales bacterium]
MIKSETKHSAARPTRVALIVAAALAAALSLLCSTGKASDHIDSPSITQDRGSDLTDTYAFLDPSDNDQVVLIMSTQGFVVSGEHFGMAIFDHNIRYRFEIENTGDAKPDLFVDVIYSKGLGREKTQTATITLPGGKSFTAPTTMATQEYKAPEIVVSADKESGTRFFGGVADDPFFLDDTGANRLVGSAIKNPGHPETSYLSERGGRDTYAGFNTLITAVSVPAKLLKGASDVIGVNAVTQRHATQKFGAEGVLTGEGDWVNVDRDGNPLVNNGLIPAPRKDEYNAASTEDDAAGKFKADIVKSLKAMNTDEEHMAKLAKIAVENGDILRLDLTVPNKGSGGGNNKDGGFGKMGGRRLQDDVVDMVFTMIANGKPLGDKVDENEKPFRDKFPFVADPTQPFHSGEKDDHTRQ